MLRTVLDTHAVIWYIFAAQRLSNIARNTIERIATEGNQAAFSSITLAEIVYLTEKGRIHASTLNHLLTAINREDALLVEIRFDQGIAQALGQVARTQIPDLPDRIIAATALYSGLPLISRDQRIQLSEIETIW